jgi:AbrB family looped-hinge helix DNA binding protein
MNNAFKVEALSSVTSKGQTTIPKAVRDALGIKDGTPLRWTLVDGVLSVRAKTKRLEDLSGALGPPPNGRRASIEDMNEAIAEAAVERFKSAVKR